VGDVRIKPHDLGSRRRGRLEQITVGAASFLRTKAAIGKGVTAKKGP
jgi:hypothetical protein